MPRSWTAATSFTNVFVDLYFLRQLVRPGGLIVLDDCDWPSVATAVRYFEVNTGWRRERLGSDTRVCAYRLPDPPVEASFERFVPFGLDPTPLNTFAARVTTRSFVRSLSWRFESSSCNMRRRSGSPVIPASQISAEPKREPRHAGSGAATLPSPSGPVRCGAPARPRSR
jgi:hypothetical protein